MSVIISGKLAKEIDRVAINDMGISSFLLMERASKALSEAVKEMGAELGIKKEELRLLFLCGTGNNGADGLCCADILYKEGYKSIRIMAAGDMQRCTEEFRFHENELLRSGISVRPFADGDDLDLLTDRDSSKEVKAPDIIVDALFGIGLRRRVEAGPQLSLIKLMNDLKKEYGSRIISADIPSGIDADKGADMCDPVEPVRADATVSFGYGKIGLYMGRGPAYSGRIKIAAIGYPKDILERIPHDAEDVIECSDEDLDRSRYKLKHRGPNANKSSYGKLLIIAGSEGMAGAAFLCGAAAFRSGIGMVRYLGPSSNRSILQILLPEAMYDSYEDCNIGERLRAAYAWADHIVVGPGLSTNAESLELMEALAKLWQESEGDKKLLLIDADGLNILAKRPELKNQLYGERTVITPHVGEMARLTGSSIDDIKADILKAASSHAVSEKVNVVLKDAATAIAFAKGGCRINVTGSAALAKAGSGDVLSGIIAGTCAVLKDDIESALPLAVYIHGLSGSAAAKLRSEHGTLAREVADVVPQVIDSLTEKI